MKKYPKTRKEIGTKRVRYEKRRLKNENEKKLPAAVMMVSMVAVTAVGCGSSNGTDTKGADANQSDATSDWDETSDVTIVSREDGSGTRGAFIELFGIEEKRMTEQRLT